MKSLIFSFSRGLVNILMITYFYLFMFYNRFTNTIWVLFSSPIKYFLNKFDKLQRYIQGEVASDSD